MHKELFRRKYQCCVCHFWIKSNFCTVWQNSPHTFILSVIKSHTHVLVLSSITYMYTCTVTCYRSASNTQHNLSPNTFSPATQQYKHTQCNARGCLGIKMFTVHFCHGRVQSLTNPHTITYMYTYNNQYTTSNVYTRLSTNNGLRSWQQWEWDTVYVQSYRMALKMRED